MLQSTMRLWSSTFRSDRLPPDMIPALANIGSVGNCQGSSAFEEFAGQYLVHNALTEKRPARSDFIFYDGKYIRIVFFRTLWKINICVSLGESL